MPQMQLKRNICLQIQLFPAKRRKIELCRNGFKGPASRAIEGVTQISHQQSVVPGTGGRVANGWNGHQQNVSNYQSFELPHKQQQLQQQLVTQQQHLQQQQQQQEVEEVEEVEEGRLMLESLQGFLIFVNKKGKVLYVTDNVEQHLGLKQECLLGKPVMDIVHPGDVKELGKQFVIHLQKSNPNDPTLTNDPVSASTGNMLQSEQKRAFYIRMRYQLTKTGCKTKQNGYVLVQWLGRLKLRASSKRAGFSVDGLICICRPVQSQSILEIRLGGNMFMSRHDLDMKFTFCDPRILTLIGYEPAEVIGKTAYYFHYPLDAQKISDCHSNLIVKGSSVSKYYRFFGKNGDWVWMQTRATIIYNTSSRPQYVVCMNYVIGEDEGQRYLMMEEEQKGIHDPNVRGCIDLTNTSTESPVSTCSSGDESHDDTGYSSGYSHSTSPQTSANMTSPDGQSSDERDSVLEDYPMSDVSQTDSLNKEVAAPSHQAVTVMSNGFDPFLSSFQEDLGLPDSATDDGMDLLDDLLKSMEEDDQICQRPSTPVESAPPITQPSTGKKPSLLRSLLDRGDNISCKSFMDYQYSKISPTPFDSSSSWINNEAGSESTFPSTSKRSQPQPPPAVTKTSLFDTSPSESAEETQSDPFIPEDLLDFAMQYCESIADEHSQGFVPTYDKDLWSCSMDDLITSLSESQTSTSSAQSTVNSSAPSVAPPTTKSEEIQVRYLDLDKVDSISKEHRYSCSNQDKCQRKQSVPAAPNGVSFSTLFNSPLSKDIPTSSSMCSRVIQASDPHSVKKSPCATAINTRNVSTSPCSGGQLARKCSSVTDSPKCYSSSMCKNGRRNSKSVYSSTVGNSGITNKSGSGNKEVRNGKSLLQLDSRGSQKLQTSSSPGIQATTSSASNRVAGQPASTTTTTSTTTTPSPQALQGMSELEKYLRGYVKRPHASKLKQDRSCGAAVSVNTPFLQRLLTGELSHEVYREIDSQMVLKERERRSSTNSISDVIG